MTFKEILEKIDGGLGLAAEGLDAIKLVTSSKEVGAAEDVVAGVRAIVGILEGAGTASVGIGQIQGAIARFKPTEAAGDAEIDAEIDELDP